MKKQDRSILSKLRTNKIVNSFDKRLWGTKYFVNPDTGEMFNLKFRRQLPYPDEKS